MVFNFLGVEVVVVVVPAARGAPPLPSPPLFPAFAPPSPLEVRSLDVLEEELIISPYGSWRLTLPFYCAQKKLCVLGELIASATALAAPWRVCTHLAMLRCNKNRKKMGNLTCGCQRLGEDWRDIHD